MNSHKHARLTACGRALLCQRVLEQGWKVGEASQAAGVSERTTYKWLARYRAEGMNGLADRSSRPKRCPQATSAEQREHFERLRRQRWPLWRIAQQSGRSLATLSRCMKRVGLSRLSALQAPVAVVRYERQNPGSCCTSTSRSSDASGEWATASPATAHSTATGALAGTRCTWPSTTTQGCPSLKCCPTRRPPVACRSCARR